MRAWNYLVSLLSLRGVLDEDILIKSIRFIIGFHDRNQENMQQNSKHQPQNLYKEINSNNEKQNMDVDS